MSTKTYDVICIGLICQDMIMSGLARGGLEEDGTTVYADSFTYTVGGDCANGAVILSRLKNHTGLLTVVDDKQTGTMIREELIREGVDVEPVKVRIPQDMEESDALQKIKDVLKKYPGNTPVYIYLKSGRTIRTGEGAGVRPSADMLSDLGDIVLNRNVKFAGRVVF